MSMRKKDRKAKAKGILKFIPIVGGVIAVIVVVIIVSKLASNSKVNFWSLTDEMVNADHTTYNYTLTIDTGKATEGDKEESTDVSQSDVENIQAEGTQDETVSGASVSGGNNIEYNINSNHFSNVWSDASGVEDYTDTDIKCTLEISGYTEGKNFKTSLKLGCNGNGATDLFNVVFVDGTYYIGVGDFKEGLKNSGVGNLVKLGNDLPDGVRYLTIPEKDFVVLTGMNEKSGAGYLKTRDGAVEMLQRSIDVFLGKIQTYTSKDNLKKSKDENSVTCGFTCAESPVIYDALKNYLAYNTENYRSQIDAMVEGGYITKEDKDKALSEVDNLANFSSKYLEVINAMSEEDMKATGFDINAQITKDGDNIYKPNYRLEFNREGKHYTISFSGECNTSEGGDAIVAPEETSIALSEYKNGGEGWKNYFIRFMNYFNVFGVDIETGITKTVGELSTDMLDSLCATINKAHEGDGSWQPVNRGTLSSYIESHSEDDEIIKSFLDTFDKYTKSTDTNIKK